MIKSLAQVLLARKWHRFFSARWPGLRTLAVTQESLGTIVLLNLAASLWGLEASFAFNPGTWTLEAIAII